MESPLSHNSTDVDHTLPRTTTSIYKLQRFLSINVSSFLLVCGFLQKLVLTSRDYKHHRLFYSSWNIVVLYYKENSLTSLYLMCWVLLVLDKRIKMIEWMT